MPALQSQGSPGQHSEFTERRDPHAEAVDEILLALNRAGAALVEARETSNGLRAFRRLAAAKMQLAVAVQRIEDLQAQIRRHIPDFELAL